MQAERFPDFFDAAPTILVQDRLAELLGAAVDGVVEYRYRDAVRLAGHSCPTVASAFLMARRALRELYGTALPQRGAIRVEARQPRESGVTGVIANVLGLVTGAADAGGFAGLAGLHRRRDMLRYGVPMRGEFRFTRLDDGRSVEVAARLDQVPGDPRTGALLGACLAGAASAEEAALFRRLWQDRVRRLLLEHADDPEVIAASAATVQSPPA
jgi:hypothetical protein